MYPVSELYKSKIERDGRILDSKIIIDHHEGSIELTNDDLSMGSLTYNSSTQSGENFTIGGTVASDLSFAIMRNHSNLVYNSNEEVNMPNQEVIPTTAEGDFDVVGEWGRNLFVLKDAVAGYVAGSTGVIYPPDAENVTSDYIDVADVNEMMYSIWVLIENTKENLLRSWTGIGLYDEHKNFIKRVTLIEPVVESGSLQYYSYEVSQYFTPDTAYIRIGSRYLANGMVKLEKGSQATPWTPAPEDFNNLKGKQYNLSTTLKKDQWYTLSVDGSFTNDEFIGLWLGNDKFIGYLNENNNITFKPNEDYEYKTIILKSLFETGTIYTIKLEEGEIATPWTANLDNVNFEGAIIRPSVGLEVSEGTFEYVPLGVFIVDEDKREMDVINLKAIDNMIRLGDKYSESTLAYPATLFQIYQNICSHNNLIPATINFPNKDYVVQEKPEGDYTFRDILGFVAELSGTFAKFNRLGQLELKWYEFVDLEISPDIRYNFKVSDEVIGITGIIFTIEGEDEEEDIVYITGTEDYAIDISDNPLLQSDYEIVLPNILNNVQGTIFRPYETEWFGNPAIDSGDMVIHETLSGELINSIITTSTFNYGRKSKMYAKATPTVKKGFEGSTSKKLNQIVRKIRQQDREYNEKITNLESAQLNAIEMMANMLGGHIIKNEESGIIYIADNPDILSATKIWKWGIDGFGYSSDGGITWETAITADGSIVAMLVSAGIVTADMVKTGILQSQDGNLQINLETGYFNLGGIVYNSDGLRINLANGKSIEETIDDLNVTGRNLILNSRETKTTWQQYKNYTWEEVMG